MFWTFLTAAALLVGGGTLVLAEGSGSKNEGSHAKESSSDAKPVEVKAELNAQALKALMDAKVPMTLLDARGPSESWIAGATPMAHDADEKALHKVVSNPHQLVVTYCGGPACPASQMLANRLAQHGYPNVIRFTGGIEAWTKAELPLTKKEAGSDSKPAKGSGSKPSGSGSH